MKLKMFFSCQMYFVIKETFKVRQQKSTMQSISNLILMNKQNLKLLQFQDFSIMIQK